MNIPSPKFKEGDAITIRVWRQRVEGDGCFDQVGTVVVAFWNDRHKYWEYRVRYKTPSGKNHSLKKTEYELKATQPPTPPREPA